MSATPESIVDDVFEGEQPPKHSLLPKRDIMPWHKPRKQWIRRFQWLQEIDELCNKIEFRDERPLRYLSLPGFDLLDIRVVRECCEKRGLKLQYLGLNDESSSSDPDTWLNIASHEVNGHASIHRDSQVIQDHFEQLATADSHAGEYLKKYGPFDVVNLDLCSSLSPSSSGLGMPNLYTALDALVNFQRKMRPPSEPWLLLITSRASEANVRSDHMDLLNNCVRENVANYPAFSDGLDSLIKGGSDLANEASPNWKGASPKDYLNMFSVGVGKWLLKRLGGGSPRCSIKMLGSYSYRVYGKNPDMVSYAYLVEGHVQSSLDGVGLSNFNGDLAAPYNEEEYALSLIEGVGNIQDVDRILYDDRTLYDKMKLETLDLLKSARYTEAQILKAFEKFDAVVERIFGDDKTPQTTDSTIVPDAACG